MTDAWLAVVLVGVSTVFLKGAGTMVLADRPLPPRAAGVVQLMGPALLAALVVVQTIGAGSSIVLDARLLGLAAAALLLALRLPLLVAVFAAALVAALARALGIA